MIAGLPYDAEVEYLESTGTQVIDLGFKGSNNTSFDIQMYRPSDSVTVSFGANSGWGRNICEFVTGNGWLYWMYGSSVGSTYVSNSSKFVGVLNFIGTTNTLVAANMTTQTSFTKVSTGPTPFTTDWNLCLFGTSENGSYGYCGSGVRVYYAKVDDGDNHVDLIPVRFTNELGQSEGAMYDRVSRKLFRNAGTGAFVIGPDVATPVMGLHFMKQIPKYTAKSYAQDGLVAMWDGIENVGYMKHSDLSETWKDLTGNGNDAEIVKSENYVRAAPFDSVAARMDGTFSFSFTPSDEIISAMKGDCTVEIVAGIGVPTFDDSVPFISLGNYSASVMEMSGAPNNFKARLFINNEVQASGMGYPFNQGAFTKSMSGASATCRCYYKGDMINSAERTYQNVSTSTGWLFGSSTVFFGGKGRWWDSGDDGYAYGLRVYSRALTAEELAHNYAVDKERFNLP